MRLDKYLSNATDYSRSQVKKLIRQRQVRVDQKIEASPAALVAAGAEVHLNRRLIEAPGSRYFMFHKPLGVVSVTKDAEHTTAIDCLDVSRPEQLQIAGRLDIDATGLLLITDDGQWNHRVTAPQKDCFKKYRVGLAESVSSELQQQWIEECQQGLWLDGEKRRTLPAEVTFIDQQNLQLKIREGKYHQVKRMCAALGNRVVSLHREAVGSIALDECLQPGEYRALTLDEVQSVDER